jgi:hypothetical protein
MPVNYRLLPGIGSDSEIEVRSKLTYNPPSDTDSGDRTSRRLLEPSVDERDNEAGKKSNKKAPRRLLEPGGKAHYESVDESDNEAGKKSNKKAPRRLLEPGGKAHYESVDESDNEASKKSNKKARKETGKASTGSSSATSGLFGGTLASSRKSDDDVPMRNGVESEGEVTRIRNCRETDYYTILGVEKSSSEKKLREAYIKLSLLTHPDNKFPGAVEAFDSELIHLFSLTMSIVQV